MNLIIITSVFSSYVLGGVIGFGISKRIRKSLRVKGWIILITLTILAAYVGVETRMISITDFTINLNWFLQGMGLGMILRMVIKHFPLRNL